MREAMERKSFDSLKAISMKARLICFLPSLEDTMFLGNYYHLKIG